MANKRIAIASVTAFLISQLLDISIFNRLRQGTWWLAPVVASSIATSLDTAIFFSVGFAGTDFPWVTVAIGDWFIKFGNGYHPPASVSNRARKQTVHGRPIRVEVLIFCRKGVNLWAMS